MAHRSPTAPWRMLSVRSGNLIQLGGLLGGLGLVRQAVRTRSPWATRMLLAGWLITYFSNHAIAHWAVGRLVGIRFVGYAVHGTTSPEWYPPVMRSIFLHIPFFSARTDRALLRATRPLSRMAMYLAGPLSTLATGLGIPIYGLAAHIPHARTVLIGAGVWLSPMLVVESIRSGGDIYRAVRELRRAAEARTHRA